MSSFAQNLNVKWRLAGFVCFMLLLIAGAGFGGLNGMKSANQSLSNVFKGQVLPLSELRTIESLFQEIVTLIDKGLFEEITLDEALVKIEDLQITFHRMTAKFIKSGEKSIGQDEINWISEAGPILERADGAINQIRLMLTEKNREALDLYTDESLYPLASEYKNMINSTIQKSLDAVKIEYEHAQERYTTSQKAFVLTLFIALTISLVASILLVNTINSPLMRITKAIDHITNGNLTMRLQHDRNDEFGVLITGFNQMADYMCELVSDIQESGIKVTSSITQLASTNKEQEATASEHAATTSEIAASTTEIAATGSNLMETTKKVNSLAKNAAFAASEGHTGLQSIDEKMVNMKDATASIVSKLSILSEKAGNIAGVVKTINKVADQTNLLSLNAAIEAEKAGEYGAGFSVVATEIRRLADQTAVATFDIELMVQEVQSAISSTVMGIDKFADDSHKNAEEVRIIAEQLAGVIEQVEVLQPQIDGLTEGIDAQTLGASQISDAINQLNDAAQQTADSISQTTSSIAQLHQAALGLQEGASRFKVNKEKTDDVTSLI